MRTGFSFKADYMLCPSWYIMHRHEEGQGQGRHEDPGAVAPLADYPTSNPIIMLW